MSERYGVCPKCHGLGKDCWLCGDTGFTGEIDSPVKIEVKRYGTEERNAKDYLERAVESVLSKKFRRRKLAEALAKAQSEMESAKKDSMNPHFKNKYADIARSLMPYAHRLLSMAYLRSIC